MDDVLFRHLRSGQAALRLDSELVWKQPRGGRLRVEARLHNNIGQPLIVGMQVCQPPKVSVYLRLQKHAWRLDIGGPEHVNRQTDHRRFARHETHVNVWRDDVGDGHAVEPWFPLRVEDPTSGVLPGDLQAIFEDFCRGSGIQLGPNYRWSDPPKPDETYEEGDVP